MRDPSGQPQNPPIPALPALRHFPCPVAALRLADAGAPPRPVLRGLLLHPRGRACLAQDGALAGKRTLSFPSEAETEGKEGKKSPRGSRSRSLRAAPTQRRQPPTPKGGGPAVGQQRSASLRAPQRREGGAPRAALLGAHIKKKQNINFVQESSVNEEEQLDPEAFQVTVGDTVMVFPPPPPPYFADCPLQTITPSMVTSDLPLSENPPPYHSTFIN
ncbi:transmembrane protein 171 isoform X3 [Podarcis muralis]